MKYFTTDLWLGINEGDFTNHTKAEIQFKKVNDEYWEHYQQILCQLPKNFIAQYNKYNGFHDCKILSISLEGGLSSYVLIKIQINKRVAQLKFKKVDKINIAVVNKDYCIQGQLSWGYAEFDLLTDGKISLNILCDIFNEIELVFETVTFSFEKGDSMRKT